MGDTILKVEQIIDTFNECTTEQKDKLIQTVTNMKDTFWKYEVIKVIFKDCNDNQKNELIQTIQMSFKAFDEVQNNDFITAILSMEDAFYAYKTLKVIFTDCNQDQIDSLMPNIEFLSQKTKFKSSTSLPEIIEKLNMSLFSEDVIYQIYSNAQQTEYNGSEQAEHNTSHEIEHDTTTFMTDDL